ncbi:hypothetical protein HanIR_Chr01g0017131 [Helianthus annuus]|nr:hypothetical protein HanIR_Chr01g0017131 [Helianthus annuus]
MPVAPNRGGRRWWGGGLVGVRQRRKAGVVCGGTGGGFGAEIGDGGGLILLNMGLNLGFDSFKSGAF